MAKKILISLCVVFLLVISGCSKKEELIEENTKLEQDIDKLKKDIESKESVEDILNFYNSITLNSVNSLVLVEASKTLSGAKYCDGVVIASNGYVYYIITDYNALNPSNGYGEIRYRVRDSKARVYEANHVGIYDAESGLLLLKVNTLGVNNSSIETILLGEQSSLLGHISSKNQSNKVQLINNIKTNIVSYNDVSFKMYSNVNFANGALLNTSNELVGIYLSKYNSFIDSNLIKYILNNVYLLPIY